MGGCIIIINSRLQTRPCLVVRRFFQHMAAARSLFLSVQYPQSIGPLGEDKLDTLLRAIQKDQVFYDYACTLNTLMFPSGESVPIDSYTPSLYCKTAPSYVTTKTDDLTPLILVQLLFVVAVSASEAALMTKTIDGLIRKHLLPQEANFSIKILVTSLNGNSTQKSMYMDNSGHLPLPYYYQFHDVAGSRVNYSLVVLLAILCLGILLLNFALHFHFQ